MKDNREYDDVYEMTDTDRRDQEWEKGIGELHVGPNQKYVVYQLASRKDRLSDWKWRNIFAV